MSAPSTYNQTEPYIFIRRDTNQVIHQADLTSYEAGHSIIARLQRELGVYVVCYSIRPLPSGPLFSPNAELQAEVTARVNTALNRTA